MSILSNTINPTISVIIPTHYRNELLAEAIESVLTQEYEPVEVIVVDDSGEGHAEPVVDRYGEVTGVIKEKNEGCGPARTTGVEASTGEYIHFLDDDDRFLQGKLSKTAAVLEQHSDVGVAYTGVKRDNACHKHPDPEMAGNVLKRTLRFETFPCYTCSMLIERDLLTDMLPLPQLTAANDNYYMIELAKRTRFSYVDELLVLYRREESETWVGTKRFDGMKEVLSIESELYDRFPEIRREVLANIYYMEGSTRLENDFWTLKAPVCFAKSTYYGRGERAKHAGALIASFGGWPGFRAAAKARSFLEA